MNTIKCCKNCKAESRINCGWHEAECSSLEGFSKFMTKEENDSQSKIKPYWIKQYPGLDPRLVCGTGPCEMCVAIVCNMDWARKIRDILNEKES